MIKKIFKLLNEWRQLPQYQLERPTKTDNDEGEIITFSELSSFVSQYDDSFSNEFKEALKNWIPRV